MLRLGALHGAFLAGLELSSRLATWVLSCAEVLPHFSTPSPQQALYRLGLVLAASLILVVVISTIDGAMLQLYVTAIRRSP